MKKKINELLRLFGQSVQIKPLARCNYHCSYCSMDLNNKDWRMKKIMPLGRARYILNRTPERIVNICGGEPLLWKPLNEFIDICLRKGRMVDTITNLSFYRKLPVSYRHKIHATYHKEMVTKEAFINVYNMYKADGHLIVVYEFGKKELKFSRLKKLQTEPNDHKLKSYGPDGKLYDNCYLKK